MHENIEPRRHESAPDPRAMGKIATVDEFIDSVLGKNAVNHTSGNHRAEPSAPVPTSPPPTLSREAYAKQQDLQARLRGENNPHFD